VQHPVDRGVEQRGVVGDHHEPPAEGAQEVAQPHDRVGVEVVGGLVEQQCLGAGEQDAGQLDAAALATRQGPQRLGHQPVGDPERLGDLGGLRLGGVAATGVQLAVGRRVAPHAPVLDRGVGRRHLELGRAQPAYDVVQPARGEDPLADGHVEVAGAGVLRQVSHLPGRLDPAGGRQPLAREDLGEGGLAGAVAPHQPDLVTRRDTEADVCHQEPRPSANFQLVSGDHG
jgi:hypothetical protein